MTLEADSIIEMCSHHLQVGQTRGQTCLGLLQQIAIGALAGSIAGPVAVPPGLVEALYRFRNEQRRGHYMAVPVDSISGDLNSGLARANRSPTSLANG